ncbi:hypothetical protein [Kineococcus sp. SYSU DK001]
MRRHGRRRRRARQVAEGAAEVTDALGIVWTVVTFPFRVLRAVLDALT